MLVSAHACGEKITHQFHIFSTLALVHNCTSSKPCIKAVGANAFAGAKQKKKATAPKLHSHVAIIKKLLTKSVNGMLCEWELHYIRHSKIHVVSFVRRAYFSCENCNFTFVTVHVWTQYFVIRISRSKSAWTEFYQTRCLGWIHRVNTMQNI